MRSAAGGARIGLKARHAPESGRRASNPVAESAVRVWRDPSLALAWIGDQLAVEAGARTALFLMPTGIMTGIALVYAAGWRWPLAAVLPLAACLFAATVVLADRRGTAALCLIAGFVLAGMALSDIEFRRTATTTFSGEATVRIDGTVLWRDKDERGRMRYRVRIERTDRPVLSRPPEIAQVLVAGRHPAIDVGGRFRGLVRLRPPSGPAYPGGYDFAFGAYFDGLGAYGYGLGVPDPTQPVAGKAAAFSIGQALVVLRLAISERIRGTIGGAEGAVASALVTGERSGIPDDVDLWLRTTGLSHVLSISGFHMALIAGFAMTLIRAGLAAVPALTLVLPAKKIAAVAAIAVAGFYLALSGGDVAAERSFIMLSIMLLAVLFDRPALTLRNVAVSALVVLAIAPHALMTASFQMSFAATAALVGAYGGYAKWRGKRRKGAPRRPRRVLLTAVLFLLGLGASSLIAGTATAPYAAYHFQRIAPFGLIANMVALPVFSLWIMPLALVAMLLMPFGLDQPFFVLLGHGLTLVFAIAHQLHDTLPDSATGLMTPASLLILTSALLVGCFMASGLRWLAVPIAAVGLLAAPVRAALPELLIFEDGKEVAMLGSDGSLIPLRKRDDGFVTSQWKRAFVGRPDPVKATMPPIAFTCETAKSTAAASAPPALPEEDTTVPSSAAKGDVASMSVPVPAAVTDAAAGHPVKGKGKGKASGKTKGKGQRASHICRGTTRSGLRIVWTDDYRNTGLACDDADVAIVARAIKLDACRSGALLVTLRTLRRTGSLAISRAGGSMGRPVAVASMSAEPEEWNRHRSAPWPESWHKPDDIKPDAAGASAPSRRDDDATRSSPRPE